ncbi:hypothetical protein BDW02DRAFT_486096 [Decorospora gaudefroyi]|uniref:HNH domain-containing protein n=1 Tax=Decorospora gaudefroyi TaxID=184978 RepID=A0A6A5L0L1_9PLEO|nr:hypothetical protein BDW02DRAFT_486096 [Decorospora gaudefroyi]
MAEYIPAEEQANYEIFRDCLSEPVLKALAAPIDKPKPKKKKHAKRGSKNSISKPEIQQNEANSSENTPTSDAEDLGEFIEYLSALIFPSLPPDLRTLSHSLFQSSPHLQTIYTPPLPPASTTKLLNAIPPPAIDSLESYAVLPTPSDALDQHHLLTPLLTTYIATVTAPPPIWSLTRATACELCARDWVPLTYHHLIPKSTHARVLKRGWHAEERLNAVAWLCRACHSFVHRLAGNEALAKRFYSVELIVGGGVEADEEIRARVEGWVRWVGGVRWRAR